MQLHFLGTASGYPSPTRFASGLVLKNQLTGTQWLFDCGEGTQIHAQESPMVKIGRLSRIFISHTHGDHMYGLPGLLCTIAQKHKIDQDAESPADVEIFGPQGIRRFIRIALALSRAKLNFKYTVHELILNAEQKPANWRDWGSLVCDESLDPPIPSEIIGRDIHPDEDGYFSNLFPPDSKNPSDGGFRVYAIALKHTIPCVGWLLEEPPKAPALDALKATALGVPKGPLMGQLKAGKDVTLESGVLVKAADVLGESKLGRLVAIMGDTYNSDNLFGLIQKHFKRNLDALVHEATFEDAMAEEAVQKGHSTPAYATELAAKLGVRLLVLTHFSHRYQTPEKECDEPKAKAAKFDEDGRPTLQIILDDALSNQNFTGDVKLAHDFAVIDIPK